MEITAFFVALGIYASYVAMLVSGIFILATLLRDNSIMDIAYGPIYIIATTLTAHSLKISGMLPLIFSVLVGIWAARLGLRILHKNIGQPEDARYAAWRSDWCTRGVFYFLIRSFFQIYLLQGLIITLVSVPIVLTLSMYVSFSAPYLTIGAIIWLIGLTLETTADWQLDQFIARKKAGTESATLMTRGLFAYSRRPNYFGETLIWWGLAIIVLPLPYGYLGLISPLLITFIVTRVTGPMLERQFEARFGDTYRSYQKRTNYFIPWWPKQ